VAEIVASYGSASQSEKMEKFTYLYVLQSETDPSRVYTGSTRDLRERLNCHNSGEVPHTEKWSLGGLKLMLHFRMLDGRLNSNIILSPHLVALF